MHLHTNHTEYFGRLPAQKMEADRMQGDWGPEIEGKQARRGRYDDEAGEGGTYPMQDAPEWICVRRCIRAAHARTQASLVCPRVRAQSVNSMTIITL